MFRLVLEYQFDFLAYSYVVPSVLVWGLDNSRKQCSYLWKVWCIPVLKFKLAYGGWQALQVDGLFGGGLVDVLCCGGDSLEENLRWGRRLGALVDLVEFEWRSFLLLDQRGAENKGRRWRGSWPWNDGLKHIFACNIDP